MVGVLAPAEPEVKLGISAAKTPRPQRSENNNKRFFQDNLSSLRNLACFAPWRESGLLIASFMSNSKCLHLRGTKLEGACGKYICCFQTAAAIIQLLNAANITSCNPTKSERWTPRARLR